ncbi:MAG: efflux RND transporter periplasmic adaptor subunit [Acidobacteria bacterium]|nr:efflux RND transporter periplasmic adaptor subunit [Acidobacteriota bacterium]
MKYAVAASLAVLLLSACQRKDPGPVRAAEAPAVQAAVVEVKAEPFAGTVPVTGTLVSTARVDVKAEIIGHVVRFDKEEGDSVTAGETVVWLDEENYRLASGQAESGVQVAEAALEKARVLEAHSRAEHERARNLLQSGGITDKDLKLAQTAERDARAQVELAAAQLAQARATLEVARKKLRDCRIKAPVTGEIQKKFVNPGAYVEGPTLLFTLVDNRKLELESPVSSSELAPVRPGQKVSFLVNSYPGETFLGRVQEINPAVDTESRSAKVRIQVNNSSRKLKAGMFAEGEILTGVESRAIIVPATAIYRDDGSAKESFVFVVQNAKAVRRPVRIGRERDSRLEITAGLKPGDLLITEQSIELAEGVRVAARP